MADPTYFAFVAATVIQQVIVASPEEIQTNRHGASAQFVQTYKKGTVRKNYAGIGYTFDSGRNAFIPEKPFPSWTLVERTARWEAPVPYPSDGLRYRWNESLQQWVLRLPND